MKISPNVSLRGSAHGRRVAFRPPTSSMRMATTLFSGSIDVNAGGIPADEPASQRWYRLYCALSGPTMLRGR